MKHRPTLEQTYFVDYYMFCTNLSHREKQQIIYCYYLQEVPYFTSYKKHCCDVNLNIQILDTLNKAYSSLIIVHFLLVFKIRIEMHIKNIKVYIWRKAKASQQQ